MTDYIYLEWKRKSKWVRTALVIFPLSNTIDTDKKTHIKKKKKTIFSGKRNNRKKYRETDTLYCSTKEVPEKLSLSCRFDYQWFSLRINIRLGSAVSHTFSAYRPSSAWQPTPAQQTKNLPKPLNDDHIPLRRV